VSVMVRAAKEGERGTCSRIIKVNHAGEFGAAFNPGNDSQIDTKLHSCGIDGPLTGAAGAVAADVMLDGRCSL
jgi:hypothetical protein